MPLVITIDCLECTDRFLHSGESEHPQSIREIGTGPGMLNDHRLAAGQIAQRPHADPGPLELHAGGLGATELASRLLNICLVRFGRPGDLMRVTNAPAVAFEKLAVLDVLRAVAKAQRQLERLRSEEHTSELQSLRHLVCRLLLEK